LMLNHSRQKLHKHLLAVQKEKFKDFDGGLKIVVVYEKGD